MFENFNLGKLVTPAIGAAVAFLFGTSAFAQSPLTAARSASVNLTCFAGQIDHPRADQIAAATVYLTWMDPATGKNITDATGVVIADSIVSGDRLKQNRIITAAHVVRDPGPNVGPNSRLAVVDSRGEFLGWASPRAFSSDPGYTGTNIPKDDVAVLGIDSFNNQLAADTYAAIHGLALAPRQSPVSLRGSIDGPTGLGPGASGAAAIDGNGQIIGILSAGSNMGVLLQWKAGDLIKMNATHVPSIRSITMYGKADITVLPLNNPDILNALGSAGSHVTKANNPDFQFKMTIAGYPFGSCASSFGTLSADDKNPDDRETVRRLPPGMLTPR